MKGVLKKMLTSHKEVVYYTLKLDNDVIAMNELIGSDIKIIWDNKVVCTACRKQDTSFYRSSFCYKCYWNSPQASQSIFKPELCTAHLDIEERDLDWEKKFQLAPHYVYLANSSGIKVGITRSSEGITRWMDQGASQAIILAEVPNRRYSGDIEVSVKRFVSDVTNWRKMLKGKPEEVNLKEMKKMLSIYVPQELKKYIYDSDLVTEIKYPVLHYPKKIKNLKLQKEPVIEGKLLGIKGQYLILDDDRVFNVRSHEGFICTFSREENKDKQVSLF